MSSDYVLHLNFIILVLSLLHGLLKILREESRDYPIYGEN